MDPDKIIESTVDKKGKTGFSPGDTVEIDYIIHEGGNEVSLTFKGILIADKGTGMNRSITVRRLVQGVGVERVFPLFSPNVKEVKTLKYGDLNRAKLYFMRDRTGKAAVQVKEKRFLEKSGSDE